MLNKRTLSLLLLIFTLCAAYPQEMANFHFRKIQVNEGLSENTVFSILQDSKGFMWLGTKDGLNRYDGSGFRIFRHNTKEPKSLGNNFIRSIAEGSNNIFYIGTDEGVYVMNSINETFEFLNLKDKSGEKITSGVSCLKIDRHGILWIGTINQGIFTYNISTKTLHKVDIHKYDIGQNAVWAIHEDQSGCIWVATRLGLLRYNTDAQKLQAIENLFTTQHNFEHEILCIFEDQKGNLWLGTWSEGLRFYNRHSNEFISFFNDKDKANYITHIRSIFQYSDNSLLIGSDDGLYMFNTDNHACQRLDITHLSNNLSDQNIYSIAQDREGGIWIGTYFGGINYLNRSLLATEFYYPNAKKYSLSGKAVSQFCEDKNGNLWIATEDGGINFFDTKTKLFTQPIKTSYHNTHALLLDGDELWIGTFSRGIDIYNTKTKSLRNLRKNADNSSTLNDDCIFSIYKTKAGDIYVGTPVGLNMYDKANNTFMHIPSVTKFIYDIKEDDYGNIWVANYGGGVTKYDPKKREWINYDEILPKDHPIVHSKLTSIYIDNQRRLWLSSEGRGIFLYNYNTDQFTNISEADGLPNNVVYGILDDQSGNLWISCNKGIISFNPSNKNSFELYSKEDGLQSNQFNYKSSFKTKDGKFYFGGINGFNSFYPLDLSKNKNQNVPPVEITKIRLLGNSNKDLEQDIQIALNSKDKVKLPYNKSSFTISYVSLSYVSPTKNQYAYQLTGADKEWNYVGNNQSVTYVNLSPGKYIFKVRASNNNGVWNEKGTEVEIIISPPFWLSLPAKIIYLLLISAFVYFTVLFYLRKHKLKQKQHLESFKAEQENLAFKSKIDFFTTIAHEIRTPISLIKAPLEEILTTNLDKEETQQNLHIIEKNCDRLTVLINQLLDFRKMDSTTYVINPENINIKNHISELYTRFRKTAQSKNIDFEIYMPQQATINIVSDADALTKIIGNLLTNALKFTTNKIILRLESNSDGSYTISVEDNGKGIPDDLKGLIFDPFYQIQNNEGRNVGTGIGLSLVKHLADILNGKIEVSDSPNGGSVFSFTFKELAHTPKTNISSIRKEEGNLKEGIIIQQETIEDSKSSILVVEDNPDMVQFIKNYLQNEYSVDTAMGVNEALKLLEVRYYDLIISDIMMPEIDGISFTRMIKNDNNYSHIPIILLSAKTENSVKVDGLRSGADVFIEKPFSTSYIKAQITSLLENRKMILENFNRSPLASYSVLATNKYDEEFLEKINEHIEQNLSEIDFSVESLTDVLCISRSNLQRKLKSICGVTPGDYLRNYRLRKACKLLIENDLRINEVAFRVGFNSASYFTKVFYKHYGILPKDFVQKHLSSTDMS